MRIWIITMEDSLYNLDFIKEIIKKRSKDIAGITIAKGGRMKIGKKKSKVEYLLALFLIMGVRSFFKNSFITLWFKAKKKVFSKIHLTQDPGLKNFATKHGIFVDHTDNPNNPEYIDFLKNKNIDIIINQSQFIIRKPFLNVPKIGILNRHNALLPKNRGRLTPFWVLYNKEKETGVSIHFVEEGIDSGPIVVQEKILVDKNETFTSLVKKNYQVAPKAMLKALSLIEEGYTDFISNSEVKANYNSIPSIKEAWNYRKQNFSGLFWD